MADKGPWRLASSEWKSSVYGCLIRGGPRWLAPFPARAFFTSAVLLGSLWLMEPRRSFFCHTSPDASALTAFLLAVGLNALGERFPKFFPYIRWISAPQRGWPSYIISYILLGSLTRWFW